MSHHASKQASSTHLRLRQLSPWTQDRCILLIRIMRKHPSLYKSEVLREPFLCRHEKQRTWEKIAEQSGFKKTEDAKYKWRSLTNYLRQHLYNVSQKKMRRYIPNTGNPEDKYVQLTDWAFFTELEFIVPYVKYASSSLEMSASEMDLVKEGLEIEANSKSEQKKKKTCQHDLKQYQQTKVEVDTLTTDNMNDDEILKEYFQNMLKSTLKLPRFHQNRIKQQLLDCVNEQKSLNKIN